MGALVFSSIPAHLCVEIQSHLLECKIAIPHPHPDPPPLIPLQQPALIHLRLEQVGECKEIVLQGQIG